MKKKRVVEMFKIIDRSRPLNLPKVTENLPFTEIEAEVLEILHKYPYGLDEKRISAYTKYSISTISKSLKKLLHQKICYLKSSSSTKIFSIKPNRKLEVKNLCGLYTSGKSYDVFDGHYFIYSTELPKIEVSKQLKKKMSKKLKRNGWLEAAYHHHYSEWGHSEPYGFVTIRIGNKGSVVITLRLETLAFHPKLVEEINIVKLSLFSMYLREKYGLQISKFNLEFNCNYGEIPYLLDEFAVNAIKMGLKQRYKKEVEQSWLPEWEEKGTNAIENMDSIYSLRQFCKENGIKEYHLAQFFKRNPNLLEDIKKIGEI